MANIKELAEQLVSLSVKEVMELSRVLKETYGIEPTVATFAQGASTESAEIKAQTVEEKTEFDVILISPGQSKLAVVKLVKELTSLNLKDAKELVDSAPKPIKLKVSKDEAEALKNSLVAAGAEVEIK